MIEILNSLKTTREKLRKPKSPRNPHAAHIAAHKATRSDKESPGSAQGAGDPHDGRASPWAGDGV
ncbi:hypothetical protein ANO14919_135740 [Xylariales sp. No.14919]|nr:hypothetical protein ANO14919_135740 [Xylariales sp. No.14919]